MSSIKTRRDLLRQGYYQDEIEACQNCGNACVGRELVETKLVCDDCREIWEEENPTLEEIQQDLDGFDVINEEGNYSPCTNIILFNRWWID